MTGMIDFCALRCARFVPYFMVERRDTAAFNSIDAALRYDGVLKCFSDVQEPQEVVNDKNSG